MEEDSEGHIDSDVSDSWSIVDYNLDIATALKTSSDSGLSAEKSGSSKHSSNENIDECFELTEMTLSSADPLGALSPSVKVVPELSRNIPSNKKPLENHDCDCDTDGISVISDDDDEYFNWEQAAHDNYRNTMRLIESPRQISSNESPLDYDDPCDETITEELMESAAITKQSTETTTAEVYEEDAGDHDDDNNHDTVENHHDVSNDNYETANMVPFDQVPETFEDESYHQIITHSIPKKFLTYAVLVAMACIAIAHFLKSGHGKEDVLEMLDELRGENEALKFKVQDLSNAYAKLEAKVLSPKVPVKSQPITDEKDFSENIPTVRAKDLLPEFITYNAEKEIENISKKLLQHFQNIENNKIAGDFRFIEQKIVDCISKIMKRGKSESKNKILRLTELERRINQKLNQIKENGDTLNIIQWYPDKSDNLENEHVTKNNVPVTENINSKNDRLEVKPIVEPIKVFPEKINKKKSKILKKDKGKENYKYNLKNENKNFKEKIPKIKTFNGKNRQNCDQGKNKTGNWYTNRAKSREEIRKVESLSDWQFNRGRRDLKRDDAFWYFKKLNLNSRNV